MLLFFGLIAEFGILYFISRTLIQKLYAFFTLLFHSHNVATSLTILLMFPGTVVHELSHMFVAEILGVRTGKLTLVPEGVRPSGFSRSDPITAGSVMISHTDPLRRNLIGLAPILVGLIILTALSSLIDLNNLSNLSNWFNWFIFYLLFSISNSMFSSKEDLKEFLPFAVVTSLIVISTYFIGVRIMLTGNALDLATKLLDTLVKSLEIVLAVNIGLLLIMQILIELTSKITGKRIVKN